MNEANRPKHPRVSVPPTLRAYTPARVALDSTGASLTTRHALEFALAHAQARDAVHATLDVAAILDALRERGLAAVSVRSAAASRTEYPRRPDLGRTLHPDSTTPLATTPLATPPGVTTLGAPSMQSYRMGGLSFAEANDRPSPAQPATNTRQPATTLTLVLADGLSALATQRHALPLLDALLPLLRVSTTDAPDPAAPCALTPIVVAEQARVALGDEIGASLGADIAVMLIGERPGLSSPDSLGAYITWNPRPGRSDAERNCVSNIRTEGLDYATAARKIAWYVGEGRRLGLTGVALRESETALLP